MGYTHYWTFKQPKRGAMSNAQKKLDAAIADIRRIAQVYNKTASSEDRLSGYTAYTNKYSGININGKGYLAHEAFIIREYFKDNIGFNFCKTAQKPYDRVVVAALAVLKYHLGALIEVSSDGMNDDMLEGVYLARRILNKKTLQLLVGNE